MLNPERRVSSLEGLSVTSIGTTGYHGSSSSQHRNVAFC